LAILFIVAGHSIDAFIWKDNYDTSRILRIFISNGSVLFVFIAGYLFQHLSNRYETKQYLITKLKNVITPYIIISIPAIVVFVVLMERESVWPGFYDASKLHQIASFYLTGLHLAPLWFVPMIALFYFAAPLLVKADKIKAFYYLIPVFIIISCLVHRGGMPYIKFIHFFSVYVIGMWCSHYKEKINPILSKSTVLLGLATLILSLAFYEYIYTKATMTYLNYLQKVTMSLFFMGVLIKAGPRLNYKFIDTVAHVSFGIFFLHSYVLTAGKLIYQKIFSVPPQGTVISYFTVLLLTMALTTLIVLLIKQITKNKSRYLVGC
jgi:hypothetical protein